ncbi:hypothetical protein G6F43_007273 [Rhizopus delemar]|nr:hypothetical protein G6F43_007273 [Rhizopus delemar]
MDNWSPNYNKPNIEQRSSSIDPEFFNAETQRVATGLNSGGDLQSSDIGWSPTSRKQDDTRGFNESDLFHRNVDQKGPAVNNIPNPTPVQPLNDTNASQIVPDSSLSTFNDSYVPPYKKEKHRTSAPYEENILFFGDSNTTETKNYPSRSLLDQENLHRGSITTLPSAGERRRRSSAISGNKLQSPPFRRRSSNLSGAGDFLPRQEAQSTPARDDVPIGSAAFATENDRISALPVDAGHFPSTHEPAGFSLQDTYKQKTPGSARSQPHGYEEDTTTPNQASNEVSDDHQEKSYKDMATGAVASVAATATAAAAAIFGAHSDGDEATQPQQDKSMNLPPKIQEDDATEAATQPQQSDSAKSAAQLQGTLSDAAIQARRDSSFEPAIHGQDACFDTTDNICDEHMPDEQHAFCDCVKEPVIHGQQPCYLCCKDTEDSQAKPNSSPYGTATIFGTSGAGVSYLGATAPEDTKTSSALTGVEDNTLASDEGTRGLNKPLVDEHLVNEDIDQGFSTAHDANKDNGANQFESIGSVPDDKNQESSATPGFNTKAAVGGAAGGIAGGAALGSLLHKSDDESRVPGTKQQTGLHGLNKQQGVEYNPNEMNTTEPPLYNETTGYNPAFQDIKYNQMKQYDSSQEVDPLQNAYNNQPSQQDSGLGETEYTQPEGYSEGQSKEYEQSDSNTTDAVYNEPIIKHSELNKNLTGGIANPPGDRGFAAAAPNASLDSPQRDENLGSTYPPTDSSTNDKQRNQPITDHAAATSPNYNTTTQESSKDNTLPQQETDSAAIGSTNNTTSPTTAEDNTSSQRGTTTTGPVNKVNAASTTISSEEHAFGGENAFGNRESIHRTSNVVPSAVEQNHGMISDDNDTKKKSRKGSIKKVFEKIFHK